MEPAFPLLRKGRTLVARVVRHHCDINTTRRVALDGHFECKTCGFRAPMRVWGIGQAKRTMSSRMGLWHDARPITAIPASLKVEAKKEAEQRAWTSAQERFAAV